VYLLTVMMPSRADTLHWLGDEVDEQTRPEVTFADSFSSGSGGGGSTSESDVQTPTVDVDAVTDAVGNLAVVSAAAAEDFNTSSITIVVTAADEPATDDAVIGAVGGGNKDSLHSMLAQFAGDMVRWLLF